MKGEQDKSAKTARGTAQRDRYTHALMPENIHVDARELHAFLSFCARSARLISQVNDRNEPEGTWADSLEKDPAVFLAMMMDNQPAVWENEIREIIRLFYASNGTQKKEACEALIHKLLALIALLDDWYKKSVILLKWGVTSPVTPILEKAIKNELGADVQQLRIMLQQMSAANSINNNTAWAEHFAQLHPIWNEAQKLPAMPNNIDSGKNMMAAVEEMRQMILRLQFSMSFLHQRAPMWFQNALEQKNDHDPYVGLLLSFLQLFLHARDQMNTLPLKHLHHYYFDLLQQKITPQSPDKTVVCFQLADTVEQFFLPKNTLLLAGVNEQGLESHYATTEDVVLNSAKIASIRSIFVSRSDMMKSGSSYKLVSGVYAAPVANSRDGLGLPFHLENSEWPPFGEEQLDKKPSERQMVDGHLGFVVAAPIFYLCEGDREIDLQFHFTKASMAILIDLVDDISQSTGQNTNDIIPRLFSKALLIYASGEKGWFQIEKWKTDTPDRWLENGALTLCLHLSSDEPAILDNNPETLGESFDTTCPLIKIQLNPDHDIFLYSFLSPLELESLEIKTRVKGLKSLTLMNDTGLLDNSAPFLPFGAVPNRNAYMLVGSLEIFRKRLTDLKIHIEWNNLPDLEGGFAEYYKEYNPEITNNSFQVQLSALSNYNFRPQETTQREEVPLFSAESPTGKLNARTTFENLKLNHFQIKPDFQTTVLPEYSNSLRSGYFKVQLCRLPMAFGHAEYPRLFSKAILEQTRAGGGFLGLGGDSTSEISLPREPYVPIIEKLTIDYSAASSINFSSQRFEENDAQSGEKIVALYPFGRREIFSEGKAFDRYLFYLFANDGYFFIGLSGAKPKQVVQLVINIKESKRPVRNDLLKVTWSHLRDNRWEVFPESGLLSDKTRQFSTTGIVSLELPSEIDTENTVMPSGLLWLRAAAKGNLDIVGHILDVQINGVEVRWIDNGDATHFDPNVTLPYITELLQPQPEVAIVSQPIGFYAGIAKETHADFYVRTSERLRHKNRAITMWDVERLVLNKFPYLRRVKCISCMEYEKLQPGQMKVVVIPQVSEAEHEPRIGFFQLDQIGHFLRVRASAFAEIQVINPVFEKIKVSCKIVLEKGLEESKGKYLQQLHEELRHFICPWLRGSNIILGGGISKNDVLVFIRNRPYIQFVTRFSLVQIFERGPDQLDITDTAANKFERSEILPASTPWSILIPVEEHNIQVIAGSDNISPAVTAIADMRLGTDFIVLEGDEDDMMNSQVKIHPETENDEEEHEFYLFPK